MKYDQVTLPIVKASNTTVFRFAKILVFIGIAVLASSIGFFEVGTLRTIGVMMALVMIASPFALRFILDDVKKIGVIRFTAREIVIKIGKEQHEIVDVADIDELGCKIYGFEGETKTTDFLTSSGMFTIRTGSDNVIYWRIGENYQEYRFKLENALEERKVSYFLKAIEKRMNGYIPEDREEQERGDAIYKTK